MKRIVSKVWVDDKAVWIETTDGQKVCTEFSRRERLGKATPQQRGDFTLSVTGIHWPEIDEDLGFEGIFSDAHLCERTACEDAVTFLPLEEKRESL